MLKGNILVVDDVKLDRDSVRILLENNLTDVRVLTCSSKKEAVEILKENSVNIVIADMRMESEKEGYDLLLFIKKQNPTTQVIVLTAYATFADAVRCMRAGCFDFLQKPWDNEHLLETTRRALELSQSPVDRESLKERLILSDWDEIQRATDVARKGVALESLCSLLFSTIPGWQRVESHVRSSTEEIDLVIFNESTEEFWRRFGTLIIVECKNWTGKRKPGRKEFDAFYSKIKRRGEKDCRLGFFISFHGIAKTFRTELDRIAKEDIVIVFVNEDDLWRLICAANRSQFFKERVAEQLLG